MQDAQRALRLVRAQAGRFGFDPARVAVQGFSAGGHLAGRLTTRFDLSTYAPVDVAGGIGHGALVHWWKRRWA